MIKFQTNLLKDRGYDTIALPRTSIAPLQLLAKEGKSLSAIGATIDLLFEPDEEPLMLPTEDAVSFGGSRMFTFEAGVGVDFLSAIFDYFKLKDSELKAGISGNREVLIHGAFSQVSIEAAGLLDLDHFLTGAIPRAKEFRTFGDKLMNSELYVITEVLKSSSFTIEVLQEGGGGLEIIAALAKIAEGEINLNRVNEKQFSMTNDTGEALAFGFKAHRIHYDKTAWWQFWKEEDAGFTLQKEKGMVFRGDQDAVDYDQLEVSDGLVDF